MIDSVVPSISPVGPSSAAAGADLARAAAAAATSPEAASADFGAMLGQLAGNASSLLKTAEATSIAGMRGPGVGAAGGRCGDVGGADAARRHRHPRQGGVRLSRVQPDVDLRTST